MPSIARRRACIGGGDSEIVAVESDFSRSKGDATPKKRKLRSGLMAVKDREVSTPVRKSPRRTVVNGSNGAVNENVMRVRNSPVKRSLDGLISKPRWNPSDAGQVSAIKEALHVSTEPSTVVCRESEQSRIFEFCKSCVEQQKAGSLYVCGCPGTGKSLSMGRVKQLLIEWAREGGHESPDILTINCTTLSNTSEIFTKILGNCPLRKKTNGPASPLQCLQNLYSQKEQKPGTKMMLIIADELDYLITKDRAVLHDLFMLTTFPFSRCILIGVANAIDLADRFLPRLQSLNCKPMVITYRAYSKDQILRILQERLMGLPYIVFQPQALELCARKVAAASGDMRKALGICRSSVEMLEAEVKESLDVSSLRMEIGISDQQRAHETPIVRIDHMAAALSKTFTSPVVDTIQSLPQHQQIILCSAVKFFRGGKKDTTIAELSKYYMDICKSVLIPPVGFLEFSNMCKVLNDLGLVKLGQAREERLKRVTLKVDEADITFALQGVRFFKACLQ